MPQWDSGLKTVASPGDHKRAHLRTAWKPQDSFSLSHANPQTPYDSMEKSSESRHKYRPPQNEDIIRHDAGFYDLGSPAAGKRFAARKEIETVQLDRPMRQQGKKSASPERYVCQPERNKIAPNKENTQRFANKPNDTGGLLQADERHVSTHLPIGQRFSATPDINTAEVTCPTPDSSDPHYDRSKLQRMRCTPPDGALTFTRTPESEQLRYYNSTSNTPAQFLN